MFGNDALGVALALYRQPALAMDWRERPLPDGVELLLRLACREQAAFDEARQRSGFSESDCLEAATFGLQQLLFTPRADAYRVLGGERASSHDALRRHYRWLIKWLHPDRHDDGWESVYADRVNLAWQALKTPERRARYDIEQGLAAVDVSVRAPLAPEADEMVAESNATSRGAADFNPPTTIRHRTAGRRVSSPARRGGAWKAWVAAGLLLGAVLWAWPDRPRTLDDGQPLPVALDAGTPTPLRAEPPVASGVSSQPVQARTPAAASSVVAGPAPPIDATPSPAEPAREPAALTERVPAAPAIADANDVFVPDVAPAGHAPGADGPTESGPDHAGASVAAGQSASLPKVAVARRSVGSAQAAEPAVDAGDRATPPAPTPTRRLAQVPASANGPVKAPLAPVPAGSVVSGRPLQAPPTPVVVGSDNQVRPSPASTDSPPASPAASTVGGASIASEPATRAPAPLEPAPGVEPPLAQALVRRWVAAYSAGDSRQFDASLAAGLRVPLLDQMRVRLAGASMRYLEVGEMRWEQGEGQLQARASVRETFVLQGDRKAETRAGQMRFAFALEQGQVKIADIEFRPN